ncbi:hypothetical protein BS50DRAFT_175974 [Corynespora cassiicola Philippines]|uniref:Transcription factor domain-containing protein n=1 Tax=Corynespora cassiicola Philippines TaxID=1448308 RepID=A0A2T2P5P3_CORCC|nr:hypothetical protein BS50DRAFT_175974 [Corynespora cassiicola Philippines]
MLTYINLMTPDDTSDRSSTVSSVTLTSETAFLLQTYLRTVATWMDLMDHTCTYQLSIPRFALSSPLLFHGICAFTAKHLALANNCTNRYWDPVAQAHYGSALRLLIHALNSHDHSHALTATILLSSYEIVAALGSEHHRRHFLGLTMLIKHHGITARSTGIDGANFWVYVRHEIAIALGNGQSLVLNPEDWNVFWEEGERREDVLGNRVLWILARVINLVYGADGQTEAGRVERQRFLNELEEWRASLSDTFVGVPYGDADEDGFRKVYFGVTAAAAAAFWYHVVHILLYTEPTLQDPSYKPLIQDQAMRITNIAISNFPDSVKVFGTHGLFFAAKHINGLTRKARIWNIITDVEARLGYHTRNMVKKLQDLVEAGL